jgi:hypothetical protein
MFRCDDCDNIFAVYIRSHAKPITGSDAFVQFSAVPMCVINPTDRVLINLLLTAISCGLRDKIKE